MFSIIIIDRPSNFKNQEYRKVSRTNNGPLWLLKKTLLFPLKKHGLLAMNISSVVRSHGQIKGVHFLFALTLVATIFLYVDGSGNGATLSAKFLMFAESVIIF